MVQELPRPSYDTSKMGENQQSPADKENRAWLLRLTDYITQNIFSGANLETLKASLGFAAIAASGLAADVAYPKDLDATYPRTIDEKFREEPKSILDFFPPGIKTSYLSGQNPDLTVHVQNALSSGRDLFMPPNLPDVWITGPLQMTTPYQIVRWSQSTKVLYKKPLGSPITPMWIIRENADHAELHGLYADHNANGSNYILPTGAGGNIVYGSCLLQMADYSLVDGCVVKNSWDNGISVGRIPLDVAGQNNGSPIGASVKRCRTFYCGIGTHHDNTQAGGGVNAITGSRTVISDCVDMYSIAGFIFDFAGGAGGMMFGCRSLFARTSATNDPTNPSVPANKIGGFGFYCGGSHAAMIGCSVDEARIGFWLDGFSNSCHLSSCRAKGCREEGLLLQGAFNSAIDFIAEVCSFNNTNLFPAIRLKGISADQPQNASIGLMLVNPMTFGGDHTYGVQVQSGDGGQACRGSLVGGLLNGRSGPVSIQLNQPFFATGYVNSAGGISGSHGNQIIARDCPSYLVQAFGDSAQNGHLLLASATNNGKRLAMGYDSVNNLSILQSIEAAVGARPLALNPSGGDVSVFVSGVGLRKVELGAADSAGAGYRTMRMTN